MRILTCLLFIAWAVALGGCVSHGTGVNSGTGKPDAVFSFSHIERYKADSFIREAVKLQALGQTRALKKLQVMAQDREAGDRVIILCRLLFTNRPGSDFRGPRLGWAVFPGGTDYIDWPLEPVALVDGVPFLIVQGYRLSGLAESGAGYLNYCETHCAWSDFKFTVKTGKQKQGALDNLFGLPNWKTPLDEYKRASLRGQIQSNPSSGR